MARKRTVAFSAKAVNLFFHILTGCNLKCRHCYINPAQHGTATLPLETIQRWLKIFADLGKPANLVLLGGEPTLHPDLAEAVRTARRLGFASITIDTNGYLFHNILERLTPDDLDYFSFSLDGATEKANDALRGRGSYAACLEGIRRTVAKGFSTSLIYTASTANIHELEQMGPLLEDLGIERFFIQVLGIRGNPAFQGQSASQDGPLQVDRDRWLAAVPALRFPTPKSSSMTARSSRVLPGWRTIISFSPMAASTAAPCAKIFPCTAIQWKMTGSSPCRLSTKGTCLRWISRKAAS